MRSEGRSLLAALLLHGAALLAARRAFPPEPAGRSHELLPPVEVDVESAPPLPPSTESAPAPASIGSRSDATAPRKAAAPQSQVTPSPSEGLPEPPLPAPAASGAKDGFDPLESDRGPASGVIGVPGGPALWGIPGVLPPGAPPPPAPTGPPAPRAVDHDVAGRVIRDELQKHDKDIGIDLPAAGTVASSVADVVRGSDTPNEARATFAVHLDGAGRVLDVSVLQATNGATAAWGRAAGAVAAQLASRKLAMTGVYARGATVTIEVTSVVQWPSGKKSDRSRRLLREEGAPPVEVGGTDMGATATVRGDLSDIGAHPQRVVSTRFRVQPAR